jgi:glycerophosphoryl diester phosphodiesterase
MADAQRLLAIAHRGGNHANLLHRAQDIGADYVEADVRLHRGRLEVRHLKTMRWLPLLYDRHPWRLAPGWTKRMLFPRLLESLNSTMGLMIDLKGDGDELPAAIIESIRASASDRPIIVCGQNWPLVDPFVGEDGVRAMHSIGHASQLERFLQGDRTTEGISIHMRLLTKDVVAALRIRAPLIVTWPINSPEALRHVVECGVDGVTTDSLDMLKAIVAGAPYADGSAGATAPPGSDPARSR